MKNKLFYLRTGRALTQAEIANRLGVSQQVYSSWETGRTTPKPRQMQCLEDLFGVKKEEIFFGVFNYKM